MKIFHNGRLLLSSTFILIKCKGEGEGGGGETEPLRSLQPAPGGPLQPGGADQEGEGSQPVQVPLLSPPHSVTQQSLHHSPMN